MSRRKKRKQQREIRNAAYPIGLVTEHSTEVADDVDNAECETIAAEEGQVGPIHIARHRLVCSLDHQMIPHLITPTTNNFDMYALYSDDNNTLNTMLVVTL